MARLKASVLSFEEPERSFEKSRHGSQGEDSVLALYLAQYGWGRECSKAAASALLPLVPPVREGNGKGRGKTFIDAYRQNVSRSCGGDFMSLKAPFMRKDGKYSTAPDLFKGTRETLEGLILNLRAHKKNGKKVPVVVCHCTGDVFSPVIREWAIKDAPTLVSDAVLMEGWDNVNGIPVIPDGFKAVGRGGNPVPIWVRTQPNADDPSRTDWILSAGFGKGRTDWKTGSMEEFAHQVDAACR
jgi:hypothetical protein